MSVSRGCSLASISSGSFFSSVADLPVDDETVAYILFNVKYAFTEPNLCPLSTSYADVLVQRALKASREGDEIDPEVQEHMHTDLLYFILLTHVCDLEEKKEYINNLDIEANFLEIPDPSSEEPLWKVLDQMIIRERKFARRWSTKTDKKDDHRAREHAAESKKEAWDVFWEHYRAQPAKKSGTRIADARGCFGGRVATKGVYPSVSRRIVQEWDGLEHPENNEVVESPPSTAQTVFQQTWRSDGKSPRESVPQQDVRTWGFTVEDPKAALKSSKGFAHKSSRGPSAGTPGTPQHAAARSRSNSTQNQSREASPKVSARSSPRRRTGRAQADSISGASQSRSSKNRMNALIPRLSLAKIVNQASSLSPSSKFTSYDDYKRRKKVLQRTDIDDSTREFIKTASMKPQREVSIALREHKAAVEWRMARGTTERAKPGALTQRSRRIHLPAIVQKRGSETERGGLRSGLSVPPATFRRPWSREERKLPPISTPKQSNNKSAIQRYAQIVQNTGIHPQPASVSFLVSLPPKINIRGKGYGDDDLLALVAALPRDSSLTVEAFDMGENPGLTDNSACLVLHALAEGGLGTLQALYLDHCRQLFRDSISLCTKLLLPGGDLKALQVLDLSGIAIPIQEYVELASAVQMHPKLMDVRLAQTGLGRHDKAHAGRVVGLLVQASKLQALDLSWNMLDAAAFQTLGKGIVENDKLRSLALSSAGASYDDMLGGSPLLLFFEFLSADYTLTKLDISNNALNHIAPLVLEYALRRHPVLHEIDISNNPLGIAGKRSMLRLIACPQCPCLSTVALHSCNSAGRASSGGPFDGDPSGCYSMKMFQPGDRAFLKLLLSRCADGADSPPLQKLMRNAMYKLNGTQAPFNFKLLRRGDNAVWEVPVAGELSFELSAADVILGSEQSGAADIPVVQRIQNMYTRHRMRLPGGNKTMALLSLVKNAKQQEELDSLLQAVSADFVLTAEQLQGLFTTKMKHALISLDLPSALCKLLPCMIGLQEVRPVIQSTRTLMSLHTVHSRGYDLVTLNLESPNGQYSLQLSDPAEKAVTEKLLLLNRWELQVWKSTGRPDISQSGNSKNFRNTRLDDRKFVWSAEEWRAPSDDLLKFDYMSLRRPQENAEPLNEEKFQYMLRVIKDAMSEGASDLLLMRTDPNGDAIRSVCSSRHSRASSAYSSNMGHRSTSGPRPSFVAEAVERAFQRDAKRETCLSDDIILRSIRALTPQFHLCCRQCRELLCLFTNQSTRCELVVYLCQRVVDWPMNANLVHSKVDEDKWQELKHRIGYVYCFPFFQPENYVDTLDLSMNEQRRVLHLLISLMSAEHPNNIKDPKCDWNGPSSCPNWDYFQNGLPLSWSEWEKVPERGYFQCLYVCSGDNQKLKARRKFAHFVGGFSAMPEDQTQLENSLKFWTVLGGVPEDVHHYLYFMVCNFKNIRQAFQKVDSNGDGELSVKEFVEGCKKLGFRLPPLDDRPGFQDDAEGETRTSKIGKKKINQVRAHEKEEDRVEANLKAVYRFLDPNKDGSLSMREFFALEGMWRELQQSMWEFVDHCRTKFGSLDNAWHEADVDQNGSISSVEFEVLAREWQFDGPVAQVYMWLDQNGNNDVSRDEWLTLETIVKPVW